MNPQYEFEDLSTEEQVMPALALTERNLFPISEFDRKCLTRQNAHKRKGWMRNQPCPCGSGKKFKQCHWGKTGEFK